MADDPMAQFVKQDTALMPEAHNAAPIRSPNGYRWNPFAPSFVLHGLAYITDEGSPCALTRECNPPHPLL